MPINNRELERKAEEWLEEAGLSEDNYRDYLIDGFKAGYSRGVTKATSRRWKCPECGFVAGVSYNALASDGDPICNACNEEMELLPEQTEDASV